MNCNPCFPFCSACYLRATAAWSIAARASLIAGRASFVAGVAAKEQGVRPLLQRVLQKEQRVLQRNSACDEGTARVTKAARVLPYQRNAAQAMLRPPPEAHMMKLSPSFNFPSRTASSKTIGMQAEPV